MDGVGASGRARWEPRTFGEFLAECAQPAGVIERFWSPVVVSACNLDVGEVSAASAMQVFQEGFLAGRGEVGRYNQNALFQMKACAMLRAKLSMVPGRALVAAADPVAQAQRFMDRIAQGQNAL